MIGKIFKTLILTVLVLVVAVACWFVFIWDRIPGGTITADQVTQFTDMLAKRQEIVLAETNYNGVHRFTFHRKFWPDFDVDYVASGRIVYGVSVATIEIVAFRRGSVTHSLEKDGADSLQIWLQRPCPLAIEIDHERSRFIDGEWRFGVNEFDVADSVYRRAQIELRKYACRDSIINRIVADDLYKPIALFSKLLPEGTKFSVYYREQ